MLCSGGSVCLFTTMYGGLFVKRAPYVQNFSLAFLPPAFYNETTKWGKVG